jgi:hypothetical protein
MANQWFRMYSDFLNDPKMISIAFEDQRHFIGVLALKSDGVLEQECDKEILNRIVAQRLWIDYAVITDVKKRLIRAKLINDNWQPIAWNKRQFRSDHDITGAERQKRFRDNKRNALRNAPVTLPDTDTDTDTDNKQNDNNVAIDIPKSKKQKSSHKIETPLPDNFTASENVIAWYKKQGYSENIKYHLDAFICKCKAKGYTYKDWDAALENAIRSDWAKLRTTNSFTSNVESNKSNVHYFN